MVLSLILMGRYIEHIVKKKASVALTDLINLKPDTAVLIEGEKVEGIVFFFPEFWLTFKGVQIPASLIERDDLLKIVAGSKIPADGIVISGSSHVSSEKFWIFF